MSEVINQTIYQKQDAQQMFSDSKQIIGGTNNQNSLKNDLLGFNFKQKIDNNMVQVQNPIINMQKQPQGIDELFISYKQRFQNVLQLIEYKNSFNACLQQYEQLYNKDKQFFQQIIEENSVKNGQNQSQQNMNCNCDNLINFVSEMTAQIIEEKISCIQKGKQKFQQIVLGNIKDYYNIYQVLCRKENEIIEKEQSILKSYYSVKSDVQALKIIVVSLTNQILNENLQIYTSLYKKKCNEDAEEFLQKQVQFRKNLQDMISDKNSRNTSILLFLINFSRQAFSQLKEITESIFLNQSQTFKKFDDDIQQLQRQSQTQALNSYIVNSTINQSKLAKSNTQSIGQESQLKILESQTIIGDGQSYQENNLSDQLTLSPRNLADNIDSQKNRMSIFQKEFKKDQINNKLNEFSQFISNISTHYQSQNENLNNDNALNIHTNEDKNSITNQQIFLKSYSSQTSLPQNDEQNPLQNSTQNIDSDHILQMINKNIRMANQRYQQSVYYQNNVSHSSSQPRFSDPAILPELREIVLKCSKSSQQILCKANSCNNNAINNNNTDNILSDKQNDDNDTSNESDSQVNQTNAKNNMENPQKIQLHRNSLPSSLICNQEIRMDSSESTKSYLSDYNSESVIVKRKSYLTANNYPSPLSSAVKSFNTSCSQKDESQVIQKTDLYFTNQYSQQGNVINSLNSYKSEYNQFFTQQVNKRNSIINIKDTKRQLFSISNKYKRKWQIKEKSNFDDYTQLDEQYHQLACNSIVNSIESQQEKNNFIDKMYNNLIKMNNQISQSIKNYIQWIPAKLKQAPPPKTQQQPLKQNSIKNKFLNVPEDQSLRVNNYSYNKNFNKVNNTNTINGNSSQNNSVNINNSNLKISFQKSPKPINTIQSKSIIYPTSQQTFSSALDQNNTLNFLIPNHIKNQAKYVNMAVVTTPQGNIGKSIDNSVGGSQIGNSLNCLSLINQNSAPVFTKNTSQQRYEELFIKKNSSQSKRYHQGYAQRPQTPTNIKEQVIEIINNDIQQKQTKLNSLLFNHLCEGNYSDTYRNNHCNSSQSVSRHKTLKDKLNKFQQQDQFTFTKNRDQQKNEEITLDKLLNKQPQLSSRGLTTEISVLNNTINDINQNQNQKLGNITNKTTLLKQQEQQQLSQQQQIQFILLQSQSLKLSQLKQERNQYQLTPNNIQYQNDTGQSSPHKCRSSIVSANNSQSHQQRQSQQDVKMISEQFLNQSLQLQEQRKNIASSSSYLTNRYVSLSQLQQKFNIKNNQILNNAKVNFPYNKQSQTYEDDDIFKDLSTNQPLKHSKSQQNSRKKFINNLHTVK